MPWKVFKEDSKFVVRKLNSDGEPVGDPLGTHDTEAEAQSQQRALYASENSKAAVKFADTAETEIEGLLAPHGGPFNGRDLGGEFFSPNTDFVLGWYEGDRPLLWHHGLDNKVGVSVIGRIKSLSRDDLGLWMKAQLDTANEYYEAIKDLIKAGKIGLSSGSVRHLVQTNTKTGEILRWPLIEGTCTPTPCNPLAEVDFASAEKHYEAAGIKADLAALKLDSTDLPDSATAKKMKPAQMRQMVSNMAKDMDVDMSASEMDTLMGEMEEMEEDEAREHAKKKMDKMDDGKKSAAVKSMSGSYEHLIECLNGLVNPHNPFAVSDTWAYIEATFPDYFIAKQYKDGEGCYWRVEYTMGEDGCPTLGKMEQVEETYVPKKADGAEMPMADHAEMTKAFAAGLVERTKDLRERRIKEGRMLSNSNRKKLSDCLTEMQSACAAMQTLLDATEPPAKAGEVERAKARFRLLRLYATH